jgi:tight adherence protein C
MTLEQALAALAAYSAPGRSLILSRQLADVVARVRAGMPPETAISSWAHSLGVDEIAVFASSVERSRTLGVPLAEALDRQAQLGRARVRQEYLTWLNSLPSRLSLCSMLFFLPAVLIVVLLPNVLSFVRSGW